MASSDLQHYLREGIKWESSDNSKEMKDQSGWKHLIAPRIFSFSCRRFAKIKHDKGYRVQFT